MRVALYARYSAGPHQTDQSIEGQVRECTDFCKRKGFTIVETYADRHISGKTDERPEFQRLIADSKKHKFEGVVVWKTDRFARNKYDSAIYKRQLKNNGVQIFYAAEAIPEGPEGIILESLMEGLAEYYSAELAQKIKRGIHDSALKCKVINNVMPIGFRMSKDRTYEADPEASVAANKMFKMYVDQIPNVAICKYLNDLGFRTGQGNLFNKNSITRLIQNEMYIGVYERAGVRVEGGVPQIISTELFYLAQKERERRRVTKSRRNDNAEYMLSGKLFCGYCKASMQGVSGTGRHGVVYYYYQCPNSRYKKGCTKKHIQRDLLEDTIVSETAKHIAQPEILADIVEKLYALQMKDDNREEVISLYRKKLSENKQATNNILKAVEKGLATETLLERLGALESEKTALLGEIAYQESLDFGLSKDELEFFLIQFLKSDGEDWLEYKRRIIKHFVNQVYLFDDKMHICYNTGGVEATDIYLAMDFSTARFDESSSSSTWRACICIARFSFAYYRILYLQMPGEQIY